MTRSKRGKQCPACSKWVSSGNSGLVTHMKNHPICKQHLLICIGCNKEFANEGHLKSHQLQQRSSNPNSFCIQGFDKLDYVQTLSLNSSSLQTTSLNQKNISVEQRACLSQVKKKNIKKPKLCISNNSHTDGNSDFSEQSDEIKERLLTQEVQIDYPSYIQQSQNNIDNVVRPNVELLQKSDKMAAVIDKSNYQRETSNPLIEMIDKNCNTHSNNINDDGFFPNPTNDGFIGINQHQQRYAVNHDFESYENFDEYIHNNDRDLSGMATTTPSNNTTEIDNAINQEFELFTQPDSSQEVESNNQQINSDYIYERVKNISYHKSNSSFSTLEVALLELYNHHKRARAPIHLFDTTIVWLLKNASAFFQSTNDVPLIPKKIPFRKSFVKKMYEKIYSKKSTDLVKMKAMNVITSPNHVMKIPVFDFREIMSEMLSNEAIMSNLLYYDNNDPTKVHPRSCDVGEIITSDVFLHSADRLCKKENDVLFPLIMYSDELNLDVNSKLKLDPLSFTFGRLPLNLRNKSQAWRYLGFITTMKAYHHNKKKGDTKFKMEVYHRCLSILLQEIKTLQMEGGIPYDLKLKNGNYRKVNLVLYLQFVIGDTKGHDLLCTRKGSHHLSMPQMLRDCCVTPDECDNLQHICKFRKIADVIELQTSDQCEVIGFQNVKNAFFDIDMGDLDHGIFGATCGEPLHIMEMKLLELISSHFTDSLSASSQEILQRTIIHIVPLVDRGSMKNEYFSLSAFRDGLTKVKNLTGKERHARLFAIYLALMIDNCTDHILHNPKRQNGENEDSSIVSQDNIQDWIEFIEDSLIIMKWIRQLSHKRSDLYNTEYNNKISNNPRSRNFIKTEDTMCHNSRAQNCVLSYLKKYKHLIKRVEGNGLKFPKFHLMYHIVRNIARHGIVGNYDGSRPEAIAKDLAKTPGLRTQKHHKSIAFQTADRYHEDLTIMLAEQQMHQKSNMISDYSYFNLSADCTNQEDNLEELSIHSQQFDEDLGNGDILNSPISFRGSSFELVLKFVRKQINPPSDNDDDSMSSHEDNQVVLETIVSRVKWNTSKNSHLRVNDSLMQCITNWLWLDPIGGTVAKSSNPIFYTEMKLGNGKIVHCHPSYHSEISWNDWVYVDWGEGFTELVPARLYMLIDISDCDIITEDDHRVDNDLLEYDIDVLPRRLQEAHDSATSYLSLHKKWAVIHSVNDEGPIPRSSHDSSMLFSKIAKRFKLEQSIYRIIPAEDIVDQAFGYTNYSPLNDETDKEYDSTAIIVDHPSTWANRFFDFI